MSRDIRRDLERHSLAAAWLLAIVMCFAGTFQRGLWTPDEPREAEIGREMLMSGGSPMPTLDGEAFLEKPPLFPWMMALFYALFGVHPGVARLPAVLFSIGSMLVAYALGRRAGGRWAGLASAVVLATLAKFGEVSHSAVNDTALTFFVAAGHLGFVVARDRERLGEKSFGLMAAGLCTGLAFLTKSIIGPVLVVGPALMATAMMREWRFLRFAIPRLAAWCTLFVVAFGLPWVLALSKVGGWSAVRVCLVDNTLGRSVTAVPEFGHANGPLFYLGKFPVEAMPWMLVLPAVLFGATLTKTWRAGRTRLLALMVLSAVVILSLPATKRGLYLLPLYPATAAVAGVWLSRAGSKRGGPLDRATLVGLLSVTCVLMLAIAGIAAWIGCGGGVPKKLEESLRILREGHSVGGGSFGIASWLPIAIVAAIVGFVLLGPLARARSSPTPALARATVAGLLAAMLIWLCGLKPFADPLKDMSAGARACVRGVPASEPLFGLALDETTRAIIPYYTDRFIRNASTSAQAIEALAEGPSKHLVIMENAEHNIDPSLREKLELVSSTTVNSTRVLNLYRFDPER